MRIDDLLNKVGRLLRIEWTYEKLINTALIDASKCDDLILPPIEVLASIAEFAKRGEILSIRRHIAEIMEMGEQYRAFNTKLRQFADRFELEQISEFVQSLLNQK